jgi:hypothetical protein
MSHVPHILKQHEFEDLKMQLGLILRAILSISENRDVNDEQLSGLKTGASRDHALLMHQEGIKQAEEWLKS